MTERRTFIKTAGAAAFSAFATPTLIHAAGSVLSGSSIEKPLRIGIIGAENSHTIGFGKLFNIDKKFPGVELKYVWGETDEFARNASEKGQIPNIVKDPSEMLGKIDALIVDHRHPQYHLQAAVPFIKAGIPTFIDKPFCYRVAEGKAFLEMAEKMGTPVTSFSSIAQTDGTFDMKKQVDGMGEISHIIMSGPADLESPYGGIFFYGVHLVEPMMYMFGSDVRKVRVNRSGKNATATLVYGNDRMVTLIFRHLSYGWKTFVETKDGTVELQSSVQESDPPRNDADMVEMFRTGKEPRSHESILKGIAILEALERSATSDRWEEVSM